MREQSAAGNQHVVVPRKVESTFKQKLMTVSGDDFAGLAMNLDAAQCIVGQSVVAGLSRSLCRGNRVDKVVTGRY